MVVILLLSPSGSSHTPPSPPQQFFLEKPEDTQVVELTKEVTLTCRIANLSGQVQWSKDGFLLGKSARERERESDALPPSSLFFLPLDPSLRLLATTAHQTRRRLTFLVLSSSLHRQQGIASLIHSVPHTNMNCSL